MALREGSSRQRDQMYRVPKESIYGFLCAWHILGNCKEASGAEVGKAQRR